MSYVRLNERGITKLFSNPRGPVAMIIDHKARLIERNAREVIGRKYESRTGDLVEALRIVPINDPSLYRVAVGTDAQHRGFAYARALETGQTRDGVEMKVAPAKVGFMKPAVQASGFIPRGA